MQSEHWQSLRRHCFRRSSGRCERCRRRLRRGEWHLHHTTYVRKGHELPSDVEALCLHCHNLEHPRHTFRSISDQRAVAAVRRHREEPTRRSRPARGGDRLARKLVALRAALARLSSEPPLTQADRWKAARLARRPPCG